MQEKFSIEGKKLLPEILKDRAAESPEKKAFIDLLDGEDKAVVYTFSDLYNYARSIGALMQKEIPENEPALMLFPSGMEFLKTFLACLLTSVIAVPAYPPRKNKSLYRIKSIVKDSGARFILSTRQIYENTIRNFEDDTDLKGLQWILTDEVDKNSFSAYKKVFLNTDTIALLQYTSGSTGTPKGVMVSHGNIVANSEFLQRCFGYTQQTVSASWLPRFHDMGLIEGVLQGIYWGFLTITMSPVHFLQRPFRWLKAISKYKASHSGGPNFAFDICAEKISEEEKNELNLSSLNCLYNGAEPIRESSFRKFDQAFRSCGLKKSSFSPCYGMAETTLIASGISLRKGARYLAVSVSQYENGVIVPTARIDDLMIHVGVGHPWIDTEIRIVDPDSKSLLPEARIGELWIKGSTVTKGYWKNEKATEESFNAYTSDTAEGPFLRTGDLGFFFDGELFISGRIKDVIIMHGLNYFPQDIEELTENAHPAIRKTCVAAFEHHVDNKAELVIVAEVERTWLRKLNVVEICESIRKAMANEMELAVYDIVLIKTTTTFKTSSGKIQRAATKQAYLNDELSVVGRSKLDDAKTIKRKPTLLNIQAWLMSWLSTHLKVDINSIDTEASLSGIGLSSITAVELQQAFKETYDMQYPAYYFFADMSISQLAEKALEIINEESDD